MKNYTYDGSVEGLLSCIFTLYETKIPPDNISVTELEQFSLLHESHHVITNMDYAERVV